jgi:hypothetical protein
MYLYKAKGQTMWVEEEIAELEAEGVEWDEVYALIESMLADAYED